MRGRVRQIRGPSRPIRAHRRLTTRPRFSSKRPIQAAPWACCSWVGESVGRVRRLAVFSGLDVAEWRSNFVSVEPAGRKRFRASATTRSQAPWHNPESSPVPCDWACCSWVGESVGRVRSLAVFSGLEVAEWRIHFVSVEPAGRKRIRASATTRSQAPSHDPESSPVPCDVTERQRRFVAVESLERNHRNTAGYSLMVGRDRRARRFG